MRLLPHTDELARGLDRHLVGLVRPLLHRTAAAGLSRTSSSVLATLRDGGAHNVTALAAIEGVAQPSMTTLVKRLEQRGLVERAADAADRRCVNVAITDAGRDALAGMQAQRAALLAARLETLEPADRAAIAAALPALERLVAAPDDAGEDRP